jgi:two-component system heavy metal sensor histidine kinase CusS
MSSSNTASGTPAPESARWSIAGRLAVWYVASTLSLVALVAWMLYWALSADIVRENDQVLADEVQVLRSVIRDRPDDIDLLRHEAELEHVARQYARIYIRVLDERGRLIVERRRESIFDLRAPPAAGRSAGKGTSRTSWGRTVADARGLGGTRTARRRPSHRCDRRYGAPGVAGEFRVWLWAPGRALLAAGVGGYAVARRSMRPVGDHGTARGIRTSTLDRRIPTSDADRTLSRRHLHQMIARLEDAFDRLSSLGRSAPAPRAVNSLRGEIEVALGKPRSGRCPGVMESALECVRLSDMIDAAIPRGQSSRGLDRASADRRVSRGVGRVRILSPSQRTSVYDLDQWPTGRSSPCSIGRSSSALSATSSPTRSLTHPPAVVSP